MSNLASEPGLAAGSSATAGILPIKVADDGAGRGRVIVATDAGAPLDVNLVLSSGTTFLRTDKDINFIGGTALNVFANENIVGLPANAVRVKSVTILSVQRLGWELQFYSSDTFQNADADLDRFLAAIIFATTDGNQNGGAGLFRYDITGLDIPLTDGDATLELHLALGSRAGGAKNAGAAGEVVVIVGVEA